MSKNKLGQEPAFACINENYIQEGITKRFYAACAAMQGMLSTGQENVYEKDLTVMRAYQYADELLKQENL